MAKKRKKDKKEDEEYEFVPPEFDEKEFLMKEIKDTKISLMTIALAIAFGVVAGVLSALSRSMVLPSLLVGLAGVVGLKYIYGIMKIDVSHFQKKNWLGSVGTFFFTFLAIFVLSINVPFHDLAAPSVEDVVVWATDSGSTFGFEYDADSGRWVPMDANFTAVPVTASVNITAKVADNGKLSAVEIALGSSTSAYSPMVKGSDGKYQYSFSGGLDPTRDLMFYIRASDMAGNTYTFNPAVSLNVP